MLHTYKYFLKFIDKKIVFSVLILIVTLNLVYIIPRSMGISPVDIFLTRVLGGGGIGIGGGGATAAITGKIEEIRTRFKELFGLDKPPLYQYLLFWRRILTLDFGISYTNYPRTVSAVVLSALPWTLILVVPVTI